MLDNNDDQKKGRRRMGVAVPEDETWTGGIAKVV